MRPMSDAEVIQGGEPGLRVASLRLLFASLVLQLVPSQLIDTYEFLSTAGLLAFKFAIARVGFAMLGKVG